MRSRGIQRVRDIMKALLRRRKASRTSEHPTDYQVLEEDAQGLDAEYRKVVVQHLRRWGVPEACATVEIRRDGERRGKEAFVAVVCLVNWERDAAVRLLLGLPLLDKKIRRTLETHWVDDVSVFLGLQLKVATSMHGREASAELRHLIVTLTGDRHSGGGDADPVDSASAPALPRS